MKVPVQSVVTLRLVMDTVVGKFFAPEEKMEKVIKEIDHILRENGKGKLTVRKVARVVGRIVSLQRAIFQVRWHTIELHRCINAVVFKGIELGEFLYKETGGKWDYQLSLSEGAIWELQWWKENIRVVNGRDI